MNDKCYSLNEEQFYDDMEDIAYDWEVGEKVVYWEADRIHLSHSVYLTLSIVDSMIESVAESCFEDVGECGETYLEDNTMEDIIDLRKVILEWMDKNLTQPGCFGVENIKQMTGTWNGESVDFDFD